MGISSRGGRGEGGKGEKVAPEGGERDNLEIICSVGRGGVTLSGRESRRSKERI